MKNSELVTADHLARKAVIYIRQSTQYQVEHNLESSVLQVNMQQLAVDLGWAPERIEIADADTGLTGTTTTGRKEYNNLLTEVARGNIGIVISYESARVSRNQTDWYPLLDLCAVKNCLIGDKDGVYDPSRSNDRLLLGMKGMLSEYELHTLRGRLLAGAQNKAGRGELALRLPAGFFRQEDKTVAKDPNVQVQQAIELVFRTFLELKSASKTVRQMRAEGIALPRRIFHAETVWQPVTELRVLCILKNPAYAGAYAYGRTKQVKTVGQFGIERHVKKVTRQEWSVLLKDRYPAYISWETYELVQQILEDNYLEYKERQSRGTARQGAALLQGIVYCGECGHKMKLHYKKVPLYICSAMRQIYGTPDCQRIPAAPVDAQVADCFLQALAPVELDLYEKAIEQRRQGQHSFETAHSRELDRLRYQADLARRQYDKSDPDNRLVTGELERRWESALRALREAEEQLQALKRARDKVVPLAIGKELRQAFTNLGKGLPELWMKPGALKASQRKAFLRCLIEKVVLRREPETRDTIHVRIVWRGDAITELDVRVKVSSVQEMSGYSALVPAILNLTEQGMNDQEIAQTLTKQGWHSPLSETLLPRTVQRIRLQHNRSGGARPRERKFDGYLTVPQLARSLGITEGRVYYLIHTKQLEMHKDNATGIYLIPDQPERLKEIMTMEQKRHDKMSAARGHQDA